MPNLLVKDIVWPNKCCNLKVETFGNAYDALTQLKCSYFLFPLYSIRSTQIMNGRKAVANEHLFGCHHRVMISIHHFRDESQVNWICHWAIIFSVAVLKQVKVLSRNNTLRWSGLIVLHLRNTHSVARVYHQYKK